jgi:hypothetical protein
MTEFFGTPNAWRAYDKDQAELAQMAQQNQLLAAQTQHQGTLMDLNRAQVGAIQRKAEQDETELTLMRQALSAPEEAAEAGNPVAANITRFVNLGNRLTKEGLVEKGAGFLKMAADLADKTAQTEAAQARAQASRAAIAEKKAAFQADLWARVRGPQDHAAALAILRGNELTKDDPIPAYLETYDPAIVRQVAAGSKVTHDQIVEGQQASSVASANARRAAQTTTDGIRTEILARRADAYIAQKENNEKAGGVRAVASPTPAERGTIKRLAEEAGYTNFEDDDQAILMDEIAAEAKLVSKNNPARTFPMAASDALRQAASRGLLTKGERTWGIPGTRSSDKFKLDGGSATRPLPIPDSGEPKKDFHYQAGDGSVWIGIGNGKLRKVLEAGKATPAATEDEQ